MKWDVRCAKKERFFFFFMILGITLIKFLNLYPAYPNMYDSWNDVWLTWSYDYGFIRRGLLGTIIKSLGNLFGSNQNHTIRVYGYVTVFVFTAVCITITFYLVFYNYKDHNTEIVVRICLLMFFCGYGWDTWYKNYGSGDTWLIIITLFAVICAYKGWYALTMLLSLLALLMHEAFIFMYFNSVLLVLFLPMIKSKSRKNMLWFLTVALLSGIMFVFLYFFSKVNDNVSAEYIFSQHTLYTGIDYSETYYDVIKDYLFRDGKVYDFLYGIRTMYKAGIINLFFKMPFYYEIVSYWHKVLKGRSQKDKVLFLMVPLGVITTLPLFIMHVDYGRWIYAVFIYEIISIVICNIAIEDDILAEANRQLIIRIHKNMYYYIGLLVYWAMFGPIVQNPIHAAYEKVINIISLI